ncbi:MBL fold metallo-hydrolase [Herbidospora mongoliensis]|uniref:MBL fold metallo-hydrolase n=1 Tax=Herbidospora mongoliensis TaxID=688067 RepID=UPI001C3F230B|nr:MBL fold metallo-hydrolase [Herbidospora mongoliensis]
MDIVHVLGSGSAKPTANRINSSYLIETACLSLIDCSGSPSHEILRRGLDITVLRHVYLTHGHADHIYGLPSLIHSLWMLGLFREEPLAIYGSPKTLEVGRALLAPFGLEERKNAVRIQWNPVNAWSATDLNSQYGPPVTSFPVTHGNDEAVGYRLADTIFTGDAVCDDLLASAVDETARSIIIDCGGGLSSTPGHAGADDIADFLRRRPHLVSAHLTHVGFSSDEEELVLEKFLDCLASVRLLSDGDQFELS